MSALPQLCDPSSYVPHALHHEQRIWPESNCYVDLWIEILHALGLDPHPCLAFTLSTDFEGDQWTFFKPSLDALHALYGIEVQELSIWRPLAEQVVEQVTRGRLVLPEVDAYFLPDTQGTDYQRQHSKTTIAIHTIDMQAQRLGYFHNGGAFFLEGEDFAGVFRLGENVNSAALPPYVEFAKLDSLQRRSEEELVALAVALIRSQLRQVPRESPVQRFQARLGEHLQWLISGRAAFHPYAFVMLRQLGASSELAGSLMQWLTLHGEAGLESTEHEYRALATAAKALMLKTARAASTKKEFDAAPLLGAMAASWAAATRCLLARYGGGSAPRAD